MMRGRYGHNFRILLKCISSCPAYLSSNNILRFTIYSESNLLQFTSTLYAGEVREYSHSLNEEGLCKSAFQLIFAFDEAISVANKEKLTFAQVKQYCEMESNDEKFHKKLMQSKINATKDVLKTKAWVIEKNKANLAFGVGLYVIWLPTMISLEGKRDCVGICLLGGYFTGEMTATRHDGIDRAASVDFSLLFEFRS
jgi:hypothetical protein